MTSQTIRVAFAVGLEFRVVITTVNSETHHYWQSINYYLKNRQK
jgi:hypothetical protein